MCQISYELGADQFLQLRDIDARSLAVARLLSRRLNAIIMPIKYEYLRLNERIISPQMHKYFPDALEKIYASTRHVEAHSNLDPRNTKRFLDCIRRLVTVR
jgi:hypothetical protein